jgi:hypothetical protein
MISCPENTVRPSPPEKRMAGLVSVRSGPRRSSQPIGRGSGELPCNRRRLRLALRQGKHRRCRQDHAGGMVMVGRVMLAMRMGVPMPVMVPMIVPMIVIERIRRPSLSHHAGRPMRRSLDHRGDNQRHQRQHRRNPHQDPTQSAHRPAKTPASSTRLLFRR